jgi:Ca2+-binding RTX toxin-like protein
MAIKTLKSNFISMTASSGEVVDDIPSLADGTVVASHKITSTGKTIYYERLFDGNQTIVGGAVALNSAYNGFTTPKIATTIDAGDGTYWVFWNAAPDGVAAGLNTMGQHFGSDGAKIGAAVQTTQFDDGHAHIGKALIGTGLPTAPIAYAHLVSGATVQLKLSFFDTNLVATGADIVVADGFTGTINITDTELFGVGRVLVSWKETIGTGSSISAAMVNTDSGLVEATFPVLANTGLDAEVDVFAGGGFVITCREKISTSPTGDRLVAYIYDAAGTLIKTADNITKLGSNSSEPIYGKEFETVALADGRFAVMWVTDDHANDKNTVLFLQFFDQTGYSTSDEILLGYVPKQSGGINLHAELNSAGLLMVNWVGLEAGVLVKHSSVLDPTKFVGTDHHDFWTGGADSETMHGLGGDDELRGQGGDDRLYGEAGSDVLIGGAGADALNGGGGFDYASYFFGTAVKVDLANSSANTGEALLDTFTSIEGVIGSNMENDSLYGDAGPNELYGKGGNDLLVGRGGDDVLYGGAGGDVFYGGAGNDTVSYAQDGAVKVVLSQSQGTLGAAKLDRYYSIENIIGSEVGNDTLYGDNLINKIQGLGGSDTIYGFAEDDELSGGLGADNIYGNDGNDFLDGGAGNDILRGGYGEDVLVAGAGLDVLDGGYGLDAVDYTDSKAIVISLTNAFASGKAATGDRFMGIENVYGSSTGDDKISGNAIGNFIVGNGGNDKIYGMAGDDDLQGGSGADLIDGGAGSDWADYYNDAAVKVSLDSSIAGSGAAKGDKFSSIENLSGSLTGSDTLIGNSQENRINGHGGSDLLKGQGGADALYGGLGADTLNGGSGIDYYVYYRADEGKDKIVKFEKGEYFSFSGELASFAAAGHLLSNAWFQSGSSNVANSASSHFIYRTTDDTLWFDADGLGGKHSILMADLQNDYKLKATDIYIF